MSGFDYRVRTLYEAQDKQSPVIDKIAARSKAAAGALAGMGKAAQGLGGMMDSAAGAVLKMGGAMAALVGLSGGALAVKGLTTGLVEVNSRLEDSKIGFATIFNMMRGTGMEGGLALAGGLMADIRKDAAALPGEFGDFVAMAQTITAPMLNAGKGVKDIRDLTRDTVVAASALGVRYDQAAREMAMLLEGHAGGHNVLGMRLGINAHTQVNGKDFNKSSVGDRVAFINEKLAKGADSLKYFQASWSGLTSTMVDGIKALLGRATLPLFERIKTTLTAINKELGGTAANRFADTVGGVLVSAYDHLLRAVDYVVDHWGQIKQTAHEAAEKLMLAWNRIEPIAKRVADAMLDHPMAMLGSAAGARAGLGAVGAMGSMAPGLAQMAMANKANAKVTAEAVADAIAGPSGGIFGGKHGSSLGESLAANPLFGGTAAGLPAMGSGLGGLGSEAAPAAAAASESSMALVALAGPAAALAIILAAVVGVFDVLTPNIANTGLLFAQLQAWGQGMWTDIKENFGAALEETTTTLSDLWTMAKPLVDLLGIALLGAIDGAIYMFRILLSPIKMLAGAIAWVIKQIPGFSSSQGDGAWMEGQADQKPKLVELKPVDKSKYQAEYAAMMALEGKAAKLHGAGKSNVTNNNYFTVMSEADPERFAVNVATHLDKLMKSPRRAVGISSYLQH